MDGLIKSLHYVSSSTGWRRAWHESVVAFLVRKERDVYISRYGGGTWSESVTLCCPPSRQGNQKSNDWKFGFALRFRFALSFRAWHKEFYCDHLPRSDGSSVLDFDSACVGSPRSQVTTWENLPCVFSHIVFISIWCQSPRPLNMLVKHQSHVCRTWRGPGCPFHIHSWKMDLDWWWCVSSISSKPAGLGTKCWHIYIYTLLEKTWTTTPGVQDLYDWPVVVFSAPIEQFVLRDSDNGSPMVGQEDLAQQFNIPSSWLVKRPPKGLCLDEEIHLQEHL